ncbi:MAG: hypothetical protein ACKO24_10025 [Leptolyngbyaceae cyanobacterium]
MTCNRWWGSLGLLISLAGCSTSSPPSQKPLSNIQSAPQTVTAQPEFSNPAVPSTLAEMATVAVPGLIQPTIPQARVPGITAGRSDPFALLSMPPLTIGALSQPSRPSSVAVPLAPTTTSALPASLPLQSTQPLPTVAIKPLSPPDHPSSMPLIPISRLPKTSIAPAPSILTAEAIDITGAMQIGNRWSVIVKEPEAPSSRHAQVGDYLANGRVLIKRVVAGPGAGVIVVLQQDGRDISKPLSGLHPKVARQ